MSFFRSLLLVSFVGMLACPAMKVCGQQADTSFRVMTWNIWRGGREDGETAGPQRVIEIIKQSQADVVAMQETYGSGELISKELGFHFHPRGTNVSIHSRYPVVEDLSVFEEFKVAGALIELPDERQIAFYSIWLPYNAEIWAEGTRDTTDLDAMKHACQASCDDLIKIKAAIDKRLDQPKYENIPVIIAGDFNSMSHLDYIPSFKDQFDGVVMDWPTSHVLTDSGYRDAYRERFPEVDRTADRTWTPRFPAQQQDRIDYIYYVGKGLQALDSVVIDSLIDEREGADKTDRFPSDHAALVSQFSYRPAAANEEAAKSMADRLRIVSYNIKHGLGNDGRIDLDRTASVIRNLHPDIVGLQEVDESVNRSGNVDQPVWFGEKLQMNQAFGSFMDYDGGRYGLAILSRYPIESSEEIRLPAGNEPRVAIACKIKLPSGKLITAVNLHFDWVGDDGFRYAQATRLAEYLSELQTPYILLGDFNDGPDSRTLSLLSQGNLPADKPESDRLTFSSVKPVKEIDFIFASPKPAWRLIDSRVMDAKLTSDHRPVLAVFETVQEQTNTKE